MEIFLLPNKTEWAQSNLYTRLENLALSHSIFIQFSFCRKHRFIKPLLLSNIKNYSSSKRPWKTEPLCSLTALNKFLLNDLKSFALSLWYVGKAKTHSLQDLKKMDHLTVFGLSECFNSGKKTMTNIVNIQPTPV